MTRLLVVLTCALAAAAQSQPVTVFGEVRTRTEVDDRDLTGQEPATTVHLLRTRLGVEARPADRVRAVVQVQDARLWGGEDPALALGTLDGDADQLDVHQAYVELDSLGGQALALRIGRQELAYGNERLVGAVGWSNVGRAFDAARLRWRRGALAADVVAAQLVSASGPDGAQALVGAFAVWAPTPEGAVEAFVFVDADDARLAAGPDAGARRRQRTTSGVRAHGRAGRVGADVELVGQTGALATAPDAPRDDLRAWLASGEVSVRLGAFDVAAGATRLSGDAAPGDGVDRHFDTLFATNHKFYGAMDYFPRMAGTAGLEDLYVSVGGGLGHRWRGRLAAHRFVTAVDAGGGRALGTEVDLGVRYAVAPGAAVDVGVSAFRASERVASESPTTWAYAMLTVGF